MISCSGNCELKKTLMMAELVRPKKSKKHKKRTVELQDPGESSVPQDVAEEAVQDEPQAVLDEPQAVQDEPQAVLDEPQAVLDVPRAVQDEPLAAQDEPQAVQDEPQTVQDEPQAVLDEPQAGVLGESQDVTTSAEDVCVEPVTCSEGEVGQGAEEHESIADDSGVLGAGVETEGQVVSVGQEDSEEEAVQESTCAVASVHDISIEAVSTKQDAEHTVNTDYVSYMDPATVPISDFVCGDTTPSHQNDALESPDEVNTVLKKASLLRVDIEAATSETTEEVPKSWTISQDRPKALLKKLYPEIEVAQEREAFQPFTLQQLRTLYFNPMLEEREAYAEYFIEHSNQEKHEFYEILNNYYRARNKLSVTEQDLLILQKEARQVEDKIWRFVDCTATGQNVCADGSKVSATHNFKQATLDKLAVVEMDVMLKKQKDLIYDQLSLYLYSAALSRLQVESYIHELYMRCSAFTEIPQNAPVSACMPNERPMEVANQVMQLRMFLSVLFAFNRKPAKDTEFVEDIRKWITRLVATLIRVATLEDHWFLLNHLLRCPGGLGKWAANFLQVVPPVYTPETSFSSPQLDHTVVVLATLLLPVKSRDLFLLPLKVLMTPQVEKQPDNMWIIIDSDGELDEDPENSWHFLQENDVVALLNQIPLDLIFKHVLGLQGEEYDVRWTTEGGMLKLYAFCTCLLDILGRGLQNFTQSRYRQLNKRIGRMIRHTVQYVTDHWLNFMAYNVGLPESSFERLQVEYNQLFHRATTWILSSSRLGSWQFMADMPYTCASIEMMWKLIWLMHRGKIDPDVKVTKEMCLQMLKDEDDKLAFEEQLVKMPTSEAIYLLTSFAFMARARSAVDAEFVEAVTMEIYELAYISSHTREFCSKVGRELLASITLEHPFIISVLLKCIKQTIDKIGVPYKFYQRKKEKYRKEEFAEFSQVCLYLFKELPLYLWQPAEADLVILRTWLLDRDLASPENQLARLIMTNMNWGYTDEGTELALDISLHRQIAVLLVESFIKYNPDKSVGLVAEGMKQFTSALRSTPTNEQQFVTWAWELVIKLHLHHQDQPKFDHDAASFPVPDINSDEMLAPLQKSLKSNNPLGSYVALVMTKVGHETGDFCMEGIPLLQNLVTYSHHRVAIHAIANIVPQFYLFQDYLVQNERFSSIVQKILSADESYLKMAKSLLFSEFPGALTKLFMAMIQVHLQSSNVVGWVAPRFAMEFWIKLLTQMPRWNTDKNICYILDSLIKYGFKIQECKELLEEFFYDLYTTFLKSQKDSNQLGALFSWIASGNNLPSFIDKQAMPEFPWLAYMILNAESKFEEESGLWKSLQAELVNDAGIGVEQAVKRIATHLKFPLSPTAGRLTIYRWGQQAMATDTEHPLFPVMWQRFFLRYLARPATEPGLPQRGGLGERFFGSRVYVTLIKSFRQKLDVTADWMDKKLTEMETEGYESENDEYIISKEQLKLFAKLYHTYAFWLDEPRLHDRSLYLPALPPQYQAEKLVQLFQNQTELWSDYIDFNRVDYDIGRLNQLWSSEKSQYFPKRANYKSLQEEVHPRNATKRILSRLNKRDAPLPPPSQVPIKVPVPPVNVAAMQESQGILFSLHQDFISVTDFSSSFSDREARHVGLNSNYVDNVPKVYRNDQKTSNFLVPCTSKFNPSHRCKGAAAIVINFKEMKKNEILGRQLDENRSEYKQLMLELQLPPPPSMCCAAVHVENTITALIRYHQHPPANVSLDGIREAGITLFYHMSTHVSDATDHYPPAKQFFSACIEILGQEFIRSNPQQAEQVLNTMLRTPSLAGLMSPHFVPNKCPEKYVDMYKKILEVPENQGLSLAFMLLTKFEVEKWLDSDPSASDRTRFIQVMEQGLCACGRNPQDRMNMVFEIYRSHLRIFSRYDFPKHLHEILNVLLRGSFTGLLSSVCWKDMLVSLGIINKNGFPPEDKSMVEACQNALSIQQITDSMQQIAQYFMRLRTSTTETASFGIYPKWRPYVHSLSLWNCFLSLTLAGKLSVAVSSGGMDADQALDAAWRGIFDVYAPWIQPLDNSGQVLSPWLESDADIGVEMVSTFVSAVDGLRQYFEAIPHSPQQGALTQLWVAYCKSFTMKGAPEHVLKVFHAKMVDIPWDKFYPDLSSIELMNQMKPNELKSKLHEKTEKCCYAFLATIMPKMPWPSIVQHFIYQEPVELTMKLHACLFQILVQFTADKDIMQISTIPVFFLQMDMFQWQFLDVPPLETVTSWFIENSDPRCVLAERTSEAALVLRLVKAASEFNTVHHPVGSIDVAQKRRLFVRMVVQLICKCTHLRSTDPASFKTIIINLLTEVETIVGGMVDMHKQQHQALVLTTEVLYMLNNCNPNEAIMAVITTTVKDWIASSPNSILLLPLISAACRTLASVVHMVQVIEGCMVAHFSTPGPACFREARWGNLLNSLTVPEISKEDFISSALDEGCFLTLYTCELQALPLSKSPQEEMVHINVFINWTASAKPRPDNETELFLWWAKILELILRQLDFGTEHKALLGLLNKFLPPLLLMGEDKVSAGLLGAIGLGKKSVLSTRFRLVARSLYTFLVAQMPTESYFRLEPRAPGGIGSGRGSTSSKNTQGQIVPSQQALEAVKSLESLRTNKMYLDIKDQLAYACEFIANPLHSLRDARPFFTQLVNKLFPNHYYLDVLRPANQ
ncbi:ectopic P granules protein 5 homolog isoform X2 [Lineus longissimus]|uniref:ectopic P granules protein 5 homolog isoform X2 n=1 Tax=Lineus longissimus TaxID=88925 RepID=UPI00315CDEA4